MGLRAAVESCPVGGKCQPGYPESRFRLTVCSDQLALRCVVSFRTRRWNPGKTAAVWGNEPLSGYRHKRCLSELFGTIYCCSAFPLVPQFVGCPQASDRESHPHLRSRILWPGKAVTTACKSQWKFIYVAMFRAISVHALNFDWHWYVYSFGLFSALGRFISD